MKPVAVSSSGRVIKSDRPCGIAFSQNRAMSAASSAADHALSSRFRRPGYSLYRGFGLVLPLSGFWVSIVAMSFGGRPTESYPNASEMADAAWPTPRARARTPLSQAASHSSKRRRFRRWSKTATLNFGLVSSASRRATRVAVVLPCCRSLACRLPRGMGEAVGRVICSVPCIQQLGGLHGDDNNYYRRGDAKQG